MEIKATKSEQVTVTIDAERVIYEMISKWKKAISVPDRAFISNGAWCMYEGGNHGSFEYERFVREARGNEEDIMKSFMKIALVVSDF